MTPQTAAKGVLMIKDYGNCKMYKAVCECFSDSCSHTIDIEQESNLVTVTIYTQQKTNFWQKSRWKYIWQLLTKGQATFETSLIMDKQVALNYANTIQCAIKDIENWQFTQKR